MESYQDLCATPEEHVKKPHAYYLQCRSGITHCIWNLHCTQFPERPLEVVDDSQRDHAKEIYRSNLTEEVPVEYKVVCEQPEETKEDPPSEEDKEKAALLEATRRMVDQSGQRVAEAKAGMEAFRVKSVEVRKLHIEVEAAPKWASIICS